MPEESFQEKTERATPRRRQKAREKGRVARSTELNSALMVLFGCLTLYLMGSHLSGGLQELVRYTMANAPLIAAADPSYLRIFADNMLKFFAILGPVFAVMVAIALGVNVAQVGFRVTPKAMEPKLEKLDIVKGLKRLFSVRSLVTFGRDTIKLLIIGFVAYKAIASEFEGFFLLPNMNTSELAFSMVSMALWVVMKVGAAILVIAVLDYAYQRYEYEKSIRMSKQELRDEFKDTEGSPQVKARVRQIQREQARRRMMQDVATADVVITNPTELAVALKYDHENMNAPHVVAKGERLIAQKIREIALEHDVPIVEDKPLARALFKMCNIGDMVPQKLYRVVAEVLAYVYRLRGKVVR
ncbi:MAG TPA: flagellar biosynthesis protein FlhB [Acidobacteriota bacterium]|nr:flagellar biosynthesis protein FlhB [Acidobacteriota bacterium]